MPLSRRDFLRLTSLSLVAPFLPPRPTPHSQRLTPFAPTRLGRVTSAEATVRLRPDPDSAQVRTAKKDDLVTIYGEASGKGELSHNALWFSLADGYIYSSWVQPVERVFNLPLETIPSTGVWTEVTVPFTDARLKPQADAEIIYRLYYSSVFQVVGRMDDDGLAWYKIRDKGGQRFYTPAANLRPIAPADIAPIAPTVKNKRIVVSVGEQMLRAYEGDQVVLESRVSTGTAWFSGDGTLLDFNTPTGEHRVYSKWIADHMKGADYDLPGVGWVTYFTESGAGLHSTYWHNDFGRPRSHGCVNLPPDAARWIFRWTTPEVPYYPGLARGKGNSTRIIVET